MDFTIRPATRVDTGAIARVARETWHATYAHSVAPHNMRQLLERSYAADALVEVIEAEHNWFYVAAYARNVVGFAQFLRRADSQGELARIYVLPGYQRRGIGRALLSAGAGAMADAGISLCYVSVEMDNAHAIVFYRTFGFRRHREHASFLGDQIVRLVELRVSVTVLREAVPSA